MPRRKRWEASGSYVASATEGAHQQADPGRKKLYKKNFLLYLEENDDAMDSHNRYSPSFTAIVSLQATPWIDFVRVYIITKSTFTYPGVLRCPSMSE